MTTLLDVEQFENLNWYGMPNEWDRNGNRSEIRNKTKSRYLLGWFYSVKSTSSMEIVCVGDLNSYMENRTPTFQFHSQLLPIWLLGRNRFVRTRTPYSLLIDALSETMHMYCHTHDICTSWCEKYTQCEWNITKAKRSMTYFSSTRKDKADGILQTIKYIQIARVCEVYTYAYVRIYRYNIYTEHHWTLRCG